MIEAMNHLPDDVSVRVVSVLVRLQGERTDEEFAALLGVTRVHWSHLRAGRRQPSYALVKRAAARFPSLYPVVIGDLIADAPAEPEAVAS
jgi:hypothetical protein